PILALELLEPLTLVRRQPAALAAIALGLAHPRPQRLAGAAHLARDRRNRRPLRRMLRRMLLYQADGPLAQLWGISTRSSHGSILSLSRKKPSEIPGTVQCNETLTARDWPGTRRPPT